MSNLSSIVTAIRLEYLPTRSLKFCAYSEQRIAIVSEIITQIPLTNMVPPNRHGVADSEILWAHTA